MIPLPDTDNDPFCVISRRLREEQELLHARVDPSTSGSQLILMHWSSFLPLSKLSSHSGSRNSLEAFQGWRLVFLLQAKKFKPFWDKLSAAACWDYCHSMAARLLFIQSLYRCFSQNCQTFHLFTSCSLKCHHLCTKWPTVDSHGFSLLEKDDGLNCPRLKLCTMVSWRRFCLIWLQYCILTHGRTFKECLSSVPWKDNYTNFLFLPVTNSEL